MLRAGFHCWCKLPRFPEGHRICLTQRILYGTHSSFSHILAAMGVFTVGVKKSSFTLSVPACILFLWTILDLKSNGVRGHGCPSCSFNFCSMGRCGAAFVMLDLQCMHRCTPYHGTLVLCIATSSILLSSFYHPQDLPTYCCQLAIRFHNNLQGLDKYSISEGALQQGMQAHFLLLQSFRDLVELCKQLPQQILSRCCRLSRVMMI